MEKDAIIDKGSTAACWWATAWAVSAWRCGRDCFKDGAKHWPWRGAPREPEGRFPTLPEPLRELRFISLWGALARPLLCLTSPP